MGASWVTWPLEEEEKNISHEISGFQREQMEAGVVATHLLRASTV